MNYFKKAQKRIQFNPSKSMWGSTMKKFHKRIRNRIHSGYTELEWRKLNYGTKYEVIILDKIRNMEDIVFIIDEELGIYSTYQRIDIFFEKNGIKSNKNPRNLLHFTDFPDSVEPNIENLKPILQKLLDDFLLNHSLEIDLGKDLFHPLVSKICGDV